MAIESLSNKNVMVTGGAGFIGSALVRELMKKRAKVIVYDNFLNGIMENLEEIKDEIVIVNGDITNPNFKDYLVKYNIEYLFNLAAEPYIPHSYERPKQFFEVNANGVLNVLMASKETNVRRIIQYSTSEVYGSSLYVPMDENHPTNPASTYAVSKLAADRLCYTLFHEQKIPVIVLRQFNVFGPRETHPYIIPELISQLHVSNKLRLGNIKAKRDMSYVEDAVKGAIALMGCEGAVGHAVNLGTGKSYSIAEMANIIGGIIGQGDIEIIVEKERLRPLDVDCLQCDYSKMNKLTKWNPEISFEDGIKKTIEYFNGKNKTWPWNRPLYNEAKRNS